MLLSTGPLWGQNADNALPFTSRSDDDLMIFQLKLGDMVLSEEFVGYLYPGGILFPLDQLCNDLEFAIGTTLERGVAEGWFISEDRWFSLDIPRGEVIIAGEADSFDAQLVELHASDIYVDRTLLEKWFPISLAVDMSTLVVKIQAREPLPPQMKHMRQARRKMVRSQSEEKRQGPPALRTPYRLLSTPFMDATLSQGYHKNAEGARYRGGLNLRAVGDLFYMSANLFMQSSYSPEAGFDPERVRLTLGRTDSAPVLLGPLKARQFTFGSIDADGDPLVFRAGQGNGFEISNFPLERPTEFDRTVIRGELLPGWEVELYHNQVLLDFQGSDRQGRFAFQDVPLTYGLNLFQLVFYGPQGQHREELRRFVVGSGLIRPGKLFYRGFLMEPVATGSAVDKFQAAAEMELGLTRHLSLAASSRFRDNTQHHLYQSIGLRGYRGNTFGTLDLVHNGNKGWAMKANLQAHLSGMSLTAGYQRLNAFSSSRFGDSPNGMETESSVRLANMVPFRRWLPLRFNLSARHRAFKDGTFKRDISHQAFLRRYGTSFRHILNYQSKANSSMDGALLVTRRFRGWSLRGRADYGLQPRTEFKTGSLSGNRAISSRVSAVFNAAVDLSGKTSDRYRVGLNSRFSSISVGVNAGYTSNGSLDVSATLSWGVARDSRAGRWHWRGSTMTGKAAVSSRIFLDNNGNKVFDEGDEPIEKVRLTSNAQIAKAGSNSSGFTFLTDMPVHRDVILAVYQGSLEDPFWIPSRKETTLLLRPGLIKYLDFPIVPSGEVEGTVYLEWEGQRKPLANVSLCLLNEAGERVMEVSSGYDGYYLFDSIPPGGYRVAPAPEQLARLGLSVSQNISVTIKGNGEILAGQDLVLRRMQR